MDPDILAELERMRGQPVPPEPTERPLQGRPGAPQPARPTTPTRAGNLGDVAVGVGRGAVQAVNETVDLASQAGTAVGNAVAQTGITDFLNPNEDNVGGAIGRNLVAFSRFIRGNGIIRSDGEFADIPTFEQSDSWAGRISEGIAQSAVGFVAGGRVLRAMGVQRATTTAGAIGQGAAAGAIGDFVAFDGNEERLSNLVQMVPALRNPVTAFLAANEEDSELTGRLKNTLEGLGVGAMFETVVGMARIVKHQRAGNLEAAVAETDKLRAETVRLDEEGAALTVDDVVTDDVVPARIRKQRERLVKAATEGPNADDLLRDIAEARTMDRAKMNFKPGQDEANMAVRGEWSFTHFGSSDDVVPILRTLATKAEPKTVRADLDLALRARQAADLVGEEPQDIIEFAARVAGTTTDLDVAVRTVTTVWTRSAQALNDFVGTDISKLSDVAFVDLQRRIHNAMVLTNTMAAVKSSAGRGLRALQLPDADTYLKGAADAGETAAKKALNGTPLPKTRQEVADFMEMWRLASGSPQQRMRMLQQLNTVPDQWKYLRTSLANAFTANILSGVPSIVLNVASPTAISILRTVEKSAGGAMAAVFTRDPQTRAALLSSAAAASRAYFATFQDIGTVFRYAAQAVTNNQSVLGGGSSGLARADSVGPITDAMLRAAGAKPAFGYTLGNLINIWPRMFQRLNNGLDEMAQRFSYLGEVRYNAFMEGAQKGLKGPALRTFVDDALVRSTDNLGEATSDDLLASAQRSTMTGRVGSTGSMARMAANTVNTMRKEWPETRFILPIFTVPANALGETLRRIPGVNMALAEARDELLGLRGPAVQAEAAGRTMLGAAFLLAGFYLARNSMITGAGPKATNTEDRRVWLQTNRPYSIRVGDTWVDYSRYDVAGPLLGIVATLYDRTVYRNTVNDSELETMVAGAAALGQFFKDRAALQTVAALLGDGDTSDPMMFAERFLGQTSARLIVPNFVTQLGRNVTDPVQTSPVTIAEQFVNLFPGGSERLNPQRNIFGELIHRPNDTLIENLVPVTMVKAVAWQDDPVLDEIDRLYERTGYAPGVVVSSTISGPTYDAREVRLEDGDTLFNAILRQRQTLQINGRSLRQAVQEAMDSEEYRNGVDADASNAVTEDGRNSRGAILAKVFKEYQEEAVRVVARNSDIAARRLALTRIMRRADADLTDIGIEQIERDPAVLSALGISLDDNIAAVRGE